MKTKSLSDIEWTTLWMAVRYAITRESIACTTLPDAIIKSYYHRLNELQRTQLFTEIDKTVSNGCLKHYAASTWKKFSLLLKTHLHYEATLIDDTTHTVFDFNGKIIPVDKYISYPSHQWDIPLNNIKVKDS